MRAIIHRNSLARILAIASTCFGKLNGRNTRLYSKETSLGVLAPFVIEY